MRLWTEARAAKGDERWARPFARWLQTQPLLAAKVEVKPGERFLPFPPITAMHLELRVDEILPDAIRVKAQHGSRVVPAATPPPEADGHFVIAEAKAIAAGKAPPPLALSTADCLPLTFAGHSAKTPGRLLAGLVHAGWRGFSAGIHWNALERWREEGFDPGGLYVFIGPAIFGANYECGPDVREALSAHWHARVSRRSGGLPREWRDAWQDCAFKSFSQGKIHPDLQCLAVLECVALGIPLNQVTLFRCDTFRHPLWPSHRGQQAEGREGKTSAGSRLVTHLVLG